LESKDPQNQVAEPNKPWGYLTAGQQKAILGYSKTFAAESKDKFNQLMKAAELYLKSKQFYKAADAYTLASTYEPGNPLPYAGKCHALFGAGKYMSSAYWLARAIEVYPDYPRFKIDLASMLGGDKDLIQSRIAEITQWQEKTGSGELLMLLSYVYFELGEVEQATMAINGAKVKMPESKAVNMLDEVIHLAGQQGNQPAPEPSNMVTEPNQP
jgi:tetratricopeptide (TPR) repeat protein